MKNVFAVMAIAAICCSCRSTQLVYISVQEPAPVTIPYSIKSVGVVNRSLASEKTKIIDVVDKVFSMEGANLDKEGSIAGINGLSDELIKNKRFSDVKLLDNVQLSTNTPGLFPTPLSWDQVEKICRENNIDALFSLELFDTDSKISYTANTVSIKTPVGNVPAIEHKADMETLVKTGWRIYDPAERTLLDEDAITRQLSYYGKGINPVVAANALIGRKEAVKEVGDKTGHAYAFRIIPYWIRVTRDYYVKGTDNFTIAKRKAQTGNWNEAGELWKKETTNPIGKIAGRACYNMAIICEINGELDNAIQWAQKSYENYNNRLALNYVTILKNRKNNDLVLKSQQTE
jgi:Family of unknown function (DUF6340)